MDNHHIVHEPKIVTTKGEFRRSDLGSVKTETIPTARKIVKSCPFKNMSCNPHCAINVDGVCAFLSFLTGGDPK